MTNVPAEIDDPPVHILKCENPHFEDVWRGVKTFELRYNDRDYQRNDVLFLKEYNARNQTFSGRWVVVQVTHILRHGLREGWVCMSIQLVRRYEPPGVARCR